jgi:peptidoglycan hydrolase-like protein with peptidoglycan-binding domain
VSGDRRWTGGLANREWQRGSQPPVPLLDPRYVAAQIEAYRSDCYAAREYLEVKTVQALCNARLLPTAGPALAIDGVFGVRTLNAVRFLQDGKVPVDGIVGPATWPVLLGVA